MRTLIKNGFVVDPLSGVSGKLHVCLQDGLVEGVCERFEGDYDEVFDAEGMIVCPGFVDLHVHLRDPGFTHKEDIASGARSAALGGFSTICAMPNTQPAMDSLETLEYVVDKAKDVFVKVLPIGCITVSQNGKELTDFESLKKLACAFSDDGKTVMDEAVMRRAFEKAAELDLLIMSHCEPENEIVKRDIELAKQTNARLHICHVSTKESVELVREAKRQGARVTAEATPHHFSLCDEDVIDEEIPKGYFKMSPPLRSREDMEAVRRGLADGTIDAIATDHAPHADFEKEPYEIAANGIIGLQTALPLSLRLVDDGVLTLSQMVERLSTKPSEILGMKRGILKGHPADLVILDRNAQYKITRDLFASKSTNSPFIGQTVKGKVVRLYVNGGYLYE